MSASGARATLIEVARLDQAVRAPRAAVWFPLAVFGLITMLGSVMAWVLGRDQIGAYFLPAHLAGGVACAWHYRRTGRTAGLQAPLFAWLATILGITALAAACSAIGRELGSDALNLGGPAVAQMLGYSVLALWARSSMLLVLVAGIGVVAAVALTFLRGDSAIGVQLAGIGVLMLTLSVANFRRTAGSR